MKRIILICLAVVLIIPTFTFAGIIGPARVRLVDGDVMFRTPDAEEWLPASINTPLDEGDAIWCPDGAKAEIQLPDGTLVRLDSGSQLDLLANEDRFMHLHLASGRLYVRTAQTSTPDTLQIDADDTTVLPAARTRLRLDMLPNNQEDVTIYKGSAYVEGNGNRTRVRAGEHIALEEDHSELLPLNPPDSWENWNMDRDRLQSRAAKADSYLPDELRSYSAELDSSGSWVSVPEYGMVWRPSVVVSSDWAPYRSGRWIWKGDDYVWISYENWGWVPYHYGRWAVVSGFGWCWVPPARGDVYWGPGYVGWYRTGSHIGWTPLAPGEAFYGRRYYGRHSVNISTTTINTGTVVYRNRRARGGLTVLPQSDFLRGRIAAQQPTRNSSVSVSVSIGSPRLQPLRETRMPIVRQTPPRVVPPRIERHDTRELRQRFPRVTPASDTRRQPQQAPAVMTAPAAVPGQRPPAREMRTNQPAVVPADNKPTPQAAPTQREGYRQRSTAPPAVPPTMPPPSGAAPARREPSQRTSTPVTAPQEAAPQRAEKPRRESIQRGSNQRRVWRVTTPENGTERDSKERGNKGRERREK